MQNVKYEKVMLIDAKFNPVVTPPKVGDQTSVKAQQGKTLWVNDEKRRKIVYLVVKLAWASAL